LVRQRQDLLVDQEGVEQRLLGAFSKPQEERNLELETELRAAITRIGKDLERLDAEIGARFPRYAELTSRKPAELAEIQSLLRADEALLAFVPDAEEENTHVFVVRPDALLAYTVPLDEAALKEQVTRLRPPEDLSTGNLPPFDTATAYALYQSLLAPAEALLAPARHLLVVPIGALQSLPLHLLVTEAPAAHPEPKREWGEYYRNMPWLARRYAITTLPSVASLRALRLFAGQEPASEPFTGFGNPILGGGTGGSRGLASTTLFRGALADVTEVRSLVSLPDTEKELRAIAKNLKADETRALYLQERATETMVKSATLNNSRVLAFATHGLLAGELKGAAEPSLVMTPPETATVLDDGLLTASEIAQLSFNADWAVLSACNTAAADDDTPGAEGLSGLAKAFFYAGARTLLVSHWPVHSQSATLLTTQAFRIQAAQPDIGRAEAFRQSMMRLANKKYREHPFFWAPFVVVGEGY